jgi:hypothetical protein
MCNNGKDYIPYWSTEGEWRITATILVQRYDVGKLPVWERCVTMNVTYLGNSWSHLNLLSSKNYTHVHIKTNHWSCGGWTWSLIPELSSPVATLTLELDSWHMPVWPGLIGNSIMGFKHCHSFYVLWDQLYVWYICHYFVLHLMTLNEVMWVLL